MLGSADRRPAVPGGSPGTSPTHLHPDPNERTRLACFPSPIGWDHLPQRGFLNWGIHLVAGLGSHWAAEGRVRIRWPAHSPFRPLAGGASVPRAVSPFAFWGRPQKLFSLKLSKGKYGHLSLSKGSQGGVGGLPNRPGMFLPTSSCHGSHSRFRRALAGLLGIRSYSCLFGSIRPSREMKRTNIPRAPSLVPLALCLLRNS